MPILAAIRRITMEAIPFQDAFFRDLLSTLVLSSSYNFSFKAVFNMILFTF